MSLLKTGANANGETDDSETDTETFLATLTEPEREELEAMVHSTSLDGYALGKCSAKQLQ